MPEPYIAASNAWVARAGLEPFPLPDSPFVCVGHPADGADIGRVVPAPESEADALVRRIVGVPADQWVPARQAAALVLNEREWCERTVQEAVSVFGVIFQSDVPKVLAGIRAGCSAE